MDEKGLNSGIKRFDGTEFEVWSILMEGVLESKGYWYVMNQLKSASADTTAWDKADRSARTMILLNLEHNIVKAVMTCTTASQMWNKLKTIHSQKSASSKMVLWKEFYDSKMEYGMKVSDYVTRLEFIAMKLKNIGEEVSSNNLISKIVSGLSSDYKHFMSNWLATPETERTFDNLLPRLLAEESINVDSETKNATAMKMVNAGHSQAKSKRGKKAYKNVECSYCQKKGHTREECRSLKRDEKDGATERSNERPRGRGFVDKKYAVVANSGKYTSQSWLMDSGASFHMTGQRQWITNYRQHSDKIPIRVGNNEYLHALGSGTVETISTVDSKKIVVSLTDVHYVPGISDNLLSQGAVDDKGIKVVTTGGSIQLIADGTTIITGKKGHGNLYRLNLAVPMQANIARSERTLEEWHKVLGHPDVNEIKNLAKKGCTVGFKIVSEQANSGERCGECQQGKCTHVPHPTSRRERAKEVLERVHVDLVGPIDPPSIAGSKYFMLVRDEYSAYMHVFFLASKTQVLHAMRKYLNVASIQSQRKVKIVRSDNGTEFKNTAMKLLFESEQIIQEFSVPFTAQQNGEIERANRTIIETARTMLCSSKLPISLWGEAVLTAVYLRNLVTNKRCGDKTPFELFHGKAPDYSNLIEFGKELQALDTKKGLSKFSSKTKDVYMVGYGERINVYRVYNGKTHDVELTSDVVIASHSAHDKPTSNNFGATFTIDSQSCDAPTSNAAENFNDDDDTSSGQNLPPPPSQIDLPPTPESSARQRCTLDTPALDATFIIEQENNKDVEKQPREMHDDALGADAYTDRQVAAPPRTTSLSPSSSHANEQASVVL